MGYIKENIKYVQYINTKSYFSVQILSSILINSIKLCDIKYNEIIILCIGTSKIIGDSIAPIVGSKLLKLKLKHNVYIYGNTLNEVNANNIVDVTKKIYINHKNPLIIAVDASFGSKNTIGYIFAGLGGLKPASAVGKNIITVGDIYIKAVIGEYNPFKRLTIKELNNIDKELIKSMTSTISKALYFAIEH